MSIKIITDSASDLTPGYDPDIYVVPMHVFFGEEEYLDGETLSHEGFYEKLVECEELPKTSQIPPYEFEKWYKKVIADGDTAIVITLSGKLSGTYQSACIAAEEYAGKIYVVDSESVTLGERALITLAQNMIASGMEAAEIAAELTKARDRIQIVALLDTLEYLKKGGRIPKSVAALGEFLSIKPVVSLDHGEVAMLGKAHGSKNGNNLLVNCIQKAGGVDFDMPYYLGYTGLSDRLLKKYIQDNRALWEDHVDKLDFTCIGGTIGTHVGPGAIAVAFFAKES